MKRHPDELKEDTREVHFWTHDEARKAIPYVRSVLRSVREHYLEMQAEDDRLRKLTGQPGRPNRTALIQHNEMTRRREEARGNFLNAIDELEDIDVFCIGPTDGEAIIPFMQGEQPAWFIFDLFADEPLTKWRYHSDSVETYRPIQETTLAV